MDVPTDLKDWWIYLIPGCFLIVEILFIYDAIIQISPNLLGPKFKIFEVWSYTETQMVLFLLLMISVSLIIGSMLEGLSYRLFERFQKKSSIILSSFQEIRSSNEKRLQNTVSNPDIFPSELWDGSLDKMEKNMEAVGEFIESQLLHEADKDEAESLNETAVSITFTQSFFVSFIFFPLIIGWMFVYEFTGIAVPFSIFYFLFLYYLWKDQSTLTKMYWKKTFNCFLSHLWNRKMKIQESKSKNTIVN